eukprot:Nk52_evm1s2251 gene=Nk52_evmTU1s2251
MAIVTDLKIPSGENTVTEKSAMVESNITNASASKQSEARVEEVSDKQEINGVPKLSENTPPQTKS